MEQEIKSATPGDKTVWIFDPGHCGMCGTKYLQKSGKRSPSVPPGIYEGEFNADIVSRLIARCLHHSVPCQVTREGPDRVTESQRIARANQTTAPAVFLSVHANASPGEGWSSAEGIKIFHGRSDESEKLAKRLLVSVYIETGAASRGTKSSGLIILNRTKMPALLLEAGFMTNRSEAELLADTYYRRLIVDGIWKFMCSINRTDEK